MDLYTIPGAYEPPKAVAVKEHIAWFKIMHRMQ